MKEQSKYTILIIDDDPVCVRFLMNILQNDYKLFLAKNGKDGIATAINEAPDLIILDVNMPGATGYEVISSLQNMDETRKIPVIFHTSMDSPTDKEKGLKLGAVDYLCKNFSPDILKERIDNQIRTINAKNH